ncbi:MAG: hypothetical protein ABIK28_00655 [Planctomycetota bacterium]
MRTDKKPNSFPAHLLAMVLLGSAIIGICIIPACGRSPDLAMTQKFQEAQDRFNNATSAAEFLETACLYEQIIDQGLVCGALYYNLGNAYMQADQKGHAVAAYRQAKRFLPRNPFLDANLRFALGSDSFEKQKTHLIDHVLFWQDWLSYPEKIEITLLMAGISLSFALIALMRRYRKLWKRLTLVALIITVVAMSSAGYDYYRFEILKNGVVIKDHVIARKGNSETYEPSFTNTLTEGTEFRVKDMDSRQAWILIQLKEGPAQEGWIRADEAVLY